MEIAHASECLIGIASVQKTNCPTRAQSRPRKVLNRRLLAAPFCRPRARRVSGVRYRRFDVNNEAGCLQEAAHIKQLGFRRQIADQPVSDRFAAQPLRTHPEEVDYARRVVEAAAEAAAREGLGAFP
ncbi:hypothetical protein ACNKHU_03235 [Shigella flexneri]